MSSPRVPPVVLRFGVRQLRKRVLNADLSWEAQRRRLDTVTKSPLPKGASVVERVYGGVDAQVVTAAGVTEPSRTIVHFHGGGYCVGSPQMARGWAVGLSAQTGSRVVLPQYRLAPEHPHPKALEDGRALLAALSEDGGAAPSSTVISGDSAGAGLALSLVMGQRDAGQPLPAGCILLSPWLDLGRDWHADLALVSRDVLLSPSWLEACAAAYAGASKRADLEVSPLLGSQAGLPPLLVQAGAHELLVPDAEGLVAKATEAGVDVTYTKWPRMWHNFQLQAGQLAAADSALSQAAWWVEKVLP